MFVVRSDIATVKLCVTPSANGNGDLRGLARRCPENGSFTELICCFSRHYCRKRQGFTEHIKSGFRCSKADSSGSKVPLFMETFGIDRVAEGNGCGGIHKVFKRRSHIFRFKSLLKAKLINIQVIFNFKRIKLAAQYAERFSSLQVLSNGFLSILLYVTV